MVGKVSYSQVGGIRKSINLGREWQETHPEIAILFRGGKTAPEIVRELNLAEEHSITPKTASVAVYKYLKGHDGRFDIPAYEGALPREEVSRMLETNRSLNGRRNGTRGLSEKKGIFGLTKNQKKEAGRKGGLKSTLAKGELHWGAEELNALYRISNELDSRYRSGMYQGKYNHPRIIARLVGEGYPERTKNSVQTKLYAHQRSLERKLDEQNF
ncbi:MAG: hypothetical protein AABX53_03875 [Nanoarchaeota archaeon]